MKNISEVVEKSAKIVKSDWETWPVHLYYSIEGHSVHTTAGEGRVLIAELYQPHTEEEIIEAVEEWIRG